MRVMETCASRVDDPAPADIIMLLDAHVTWRGRGRGTIVVMGGQGWREEEEEGEA